ncbi:MAG: sulfite exporter TauE/SafE family protein [Planctomycetes bacterium]|nr:sulfite exporter TauE/SafE family protein [Planctomycetota bacterium]NOG54554.1 sulfite exporter TauE/SafE family protein [Planctomycetota bacterium]
MEPVQFVICITIGLAGGLLGGMLGIGGSLVMIPALAVLFGNHYGDQSQHLFQAAAMIVNLVVALAAVGRHWKAGAVRLDAVKGMAPAAFCAIFIGVAASELLDGRVLMRCFAVFLIYVVLMNARKLIGEFKQSSSAGSSQQNASPTHGNEDHDRAAQTGRVTVPRSLTVGSVMGFAAGLLGIGGGGIGVPLQQVMFRTPLRHCIGTSTFVICITAGFGAIAKNYALTADETYPLTTSLLLAGALAPGALVGAGFGASLTHRLPVRWVRATFIVLLIVAGTKMGGLWGS